MGLLTPLTQHTRNKGKAKSQKEPLQKVKKSLNSPERERETERDRERDRERQRETEREIDR